MSLDSKNSLSKLPPHWHEKESTKRKGKIYYFNTVHKKTVWKIESFDPCPSMCSMCISYLQKFDSKSQTNKRSKGKTASKKERKRKHKSSNQTNDSNCKTIELESSKSKNSEILNVISEDLAPSTSKSTSPCQKKQTSKRSLDDNHSHIPKKLMKTSDNELEAKFVGKKSIKSRKVSKGKTLFKKCKNTQLDSEKSPLLSHSPILPEEGNISPLPDIPMEVDDINSEITSIRSCGSSLPQQDIQSSQDLTFNSNNIFIVVDTNIFIADINLVKYISDMKGLNCNFVVTIPYVVFQELDVLKQREKLRVSAQSAIIWCNKCLTGDGSQSVMCQSYSCYLKIQEKSSNKKADDIIRDYCLYMMHELDNKVCLLSEDVNLRNKALLSGLMTLSIKEMWKLLKSENPCHIFQNNKSERNSSKILDLSSNKEENSFSEDMVIDYAEDGDNEKHQINYVPKMINGIQQYLNGHSSEEENDSHIHQEKSVNNKDSALKSLENVLGTILERAMKDSYGEIWEKIVIIKPPWRLFQIFKCYKKHWIAVFIDKLDEKVLNKLDTVKYLIESNASIEKLSLEISELYNFLKKSKLMPSNNNNELQSCDYENPANENSYALDDYLTATTDKIELLVDEAVNCVAMGVSPANQADVHNSVTKLLDCVICLLNSMESFSLIKMLKSLVNFWTNVGDAKTVNSYSSLNATNLYLAKKKTVRLCSLRLQTCASELKKLL